METRYVREWLTESDWLLSYGHHTKKGGWLSWNRFAIAKWIMNRDERIGWIPISLNCSSCRLNSNCIPHPIEDESTICFWHDSNPPDNRSLQQIHPICQMEVNQPKHSYSRETPYVVEVQSVDRSQRQFMYFVCTRCHRLFRDVNTSKHVNKCRGTTFRCVDCDEEFCVQDIPQHTDCPKAMKSVAPPLYNPKSVFDSLHCPM